MIVHLYLRTSRCEICSLLGGHQWAVVPGIIIFKCSVYFTKYGIFIIRGFMTFRKTLCLVRLPCCNFHSVSEFSTWIISEQKVNFCRLSGYQSMLCCCLWWETGLLFYSRFWTLDLNRVSTTLLLLSPHCVHAPFHPTIYRTIWKAC